MWNYSSVVKPLQFIVATSQDSFGRQIKSNAADAQLLAPTHVPEVTACSVLIVWKIASELWSCERTRGAKMAEQSILGWKPKHVNQQQLGYIICPWLKF